MFLPTSDGVLLNVVEWGSPELPAFVAHGGWVGNWELWQEPFQLMHSRWRCVAFDHRGSGATTATADDISPNVLVDDLMTVLDSLHIEQCVLAGESIGALTVMTAALRHPDRVRALVLVDGAPAAGGPGAQMLIDGSRTDYPATVRTFVDRCVPEPDSEHIRRWGRQILLRADAESAARLLESHSEENVAPEVEDLAMPTLLVHGELDAIIPLDAAKALAARIPGATLAVIPGAGHVPTLTRPQAVVDAIEGLLSGR